MRFSWGVLLALSMLGTAMARDFGPTADVRAIYSVVQAKFGGQVANVSVSHDWALCECATSDGGDLSVLLRKVGGKWKVTASDGGAWVADDLRAKGVPAGDVPQLRKTYQ